MTPEQITHIMRRYTEALRALSPEEDIYLALQQDEDFAERREAYRLAIDEVEGWPILDAMPRKGLVLESPDRRRWLYLCSYVREHEVMVIVECMSRFDVVIQLTRNKTQGLPASDR